jgi:hypothetical protein
LFVHRLLCGRVFSALLASLLASLRSRAALQLENPILFAKFGEQCWSRKVLIRQKPHTVKDFQFLSRKADLLANFFG